MYSMHVNVVVQAWLHSTLPSTPTPRPQTHQKTKENSLLVSNVEVTSSTYKCRMTEKFICNIFRDICSRMVYLINKTKKKVFEFQKTPIIYSEVKETRLHVVEMQRIC